MFLKYHLTLGNPFKNIHELRARSFWAAKCDFCSIMQKFLHDKKKFLQPKIFFHLCQISFFNKHLPFKAFEKFMRWASKIFAWWWKISAGCKNLHPRFCSPEKPHYSLLVYSILFKMMYSDLTASIYLRGCKIARGQSMRSEKLSFFFLGFH